MKNLKKTQKPDIRYPARPDIRQTKIQYPAGYRIWKKAGYPVHPYWKGLDVRNRHAKFQSSSFSSS